MIETTTMLAHASMPLAQALTILAQAAPTTAPASPPAPTLGDYLNSPFIGLALIIIVFWFLLFSGRRREQKRYEQMLNSLKRNDRVQTIGGIVGTVYEVRDNVVVLKVDEANNTKIQFARSAIKEVLRESAPAPVK